MGSSVYLEHIQVQIILAREKLKAFTAFSSLFLQNAVDGGYLVDRSSRLTGRVHVTKWILWKSSLPHKSGKPVHVQAVST